MRITTPPEHIVFLTKRLASEGHEVFLVGGCVRDSVMGRPVHDWDIATSAAPVDVARLFPKTVMTGERFGTIIVILRESSVEVTTFRTEGEYHDGRHPENVEFASSISEDLSRRDFTINAMAESNDGELFDPFGGLEDLRNGIIRCVGGPNTRFSEDALRMFRALRFSAQFGFEIEPDTLRAIYAGAPAAARISAERISAEIEKTLSTQRPEIAGEMIKIGLLDRYMSVSGKNPGGLEKIAKLPCEPTLRWCAFCAVLLDKHYINTAEEFLHDMRLDKKAIKTCSHALDIHAFPRDRTEVKRLLAKNDPDVVRCAAAISDILGEESALDITDNAGSGAPDITGSGVARVVSALDITDSIIVSGECTTLGELAITGRDLLASGHPPGRKLGETLNKLLDNVIENPEHNKRETLLDIVRRLDL